MLNVDIVVTYIMIYRRPPHTGAPSLSPQGTYYHNQVTDAESECRADGGQVKNKFFILIYSQCWHSSRVHSSRKHGTNEFLASGHYFHIIPVQFHCKEFKLFNYLMTGPKKCEDWARPGVSSNTLFIREQSRAAAKHIAAPAVTPTHPGINCIFISGLSEFWARNQMQNALFITFFASSVPLRVPWLINLSSITLYRLLVVAHYARC